MWEIEHGRKKLQNPSNVVIFLSGRDADKISVVIRKLGPPKRVNQLIKLSSRIKTRLPALSVAVRT